MKNLLPEKVGKIVAADFRTASVFTAHGIDFCCGGHQTLAEACAGKETEMPVILAELETVMDTRPGNQVDFRSWPLDLLTQYIAKKHHRYVTERAPLLRQYLQKLVQVHGERHPELHEIERLFAETAEALGRHMLKEEQVLFPYVDRLVIARTKPQTLPAPPFGTVSNPIRMMTDEHEAEGERLQKISALTNRYTPPTDACGTYRVTFDLLREFEQDLHEHIHLENNILFPGAIHLEEGVTR